MKVETEEKVNGGLRNSAGTMVERGEGFGWVLALGVNWLKILNLFLRTRRILIWSEDNEVVFARKKGRKDLGLGDKTYWCGLLYQNWLRLKIQSWASD